VTVELIGRQATSAASGRPCNSRYDSMLTAAAHTANRKSRFAAAPNQQSRYWLLAQPPDTPILRRMQIENREAPGVTICS